MIASAVIVGIFVLRQGWDDSSSVSANPVGDGTEQAGETPEGETATTAATTPERPNTEVVVRVFNATDTGGAAGGLTEDLAAEGWQTIEATDAPDGWQGETTEILFMPGFDREAATVAQAIGAAADVVKAAPQPPEMDPANANVLIMLGSDLADSFAD